MTKMSLKDFAKLDPREARRIAVGALPADHRGSFAVKPNENPRKGKK